MFSNPTHTLSVIIRIIFQGGMYAYAVRILSITRIFRDLRGIILQKILVILSDTQSLKSLRALIISFFFCTIYIYE